MQLFNISGIERKAIQAAAATQIVTGAAVGFHPGRSIDSPFDIMRVFLVKLDVFWKYEISDKFNKWEHFLCTFKGIWRES